MTIITNKYLDELDFLKELRLLNNYKKITILICEKENYLSLKNKINSLAYTDMVNIYTFLTNSEKEQIKIIYDKLEKLKSYD